jgi:hypothetical protein
MNAYASEVSGSRAMSQQEMQQLLQQVVARPIEQAKQISDANAKVQADQQKVQEAGKGEALDLFA